MPVLCALRSTVPRDRMARRTSGPRRWPRPIPIVEGRQILLHGAAGPSRVAIPLPILTCDRALLVGIGLYQARIDGKAFTTNQAGRNARLDHPFEHTTENVSLAEALGGRVKMTNDLG